MPAVAVGAAIGMQATSSMRSAGAYGVLGLVAGCVAVLRFAGFLAQRFFVAALLFGTTALFAREDVVHTARRAQPRFELGRLLCPRRPFLAAHSSPCLLPAARVAPAPCAPQPQPRAPISPRNRPHHSISPISEAPGSPRCAPSGRSCDARPHGRPAAQPPPSMRPPPPRARATGIAA